MISTREAALDLATLFGIAVVPTADCCRVPLVRPLKDAEGEDIPRTGGVHAASKDPRVIRAWFDQWPNANIAAACGAASGVLVLDIDRKDGRDGFAALEAMQARYGELPPSWVSVTPSDGRHLWFGQPETALRNRVNLALRRPDGTTERYDGVDIRSTGGSAALPPSRKPSGPYRWLVDPADVPLAPAPKWLCDLIDPPAPPPVPLKPLRVTSADRAARYVASAVNRECEALAAMPRGSGRNLKLFQAAANLGELVGANLLPQSMAEGALESAADACGLLREDGRHAVRATIASGMRRGLQKPRELVA